VINLVFMIKPVLRIMASDPTVVIGLVVACKVGLISAFVVLPRSSLRRYGKCSGAPCEC
jgi:hypothetical protein